MPKIERKYMAHYIDAAISGAANYVRLGKDLEEFKVNLNPTVEKKKNIMGEGSGGVASYEPEGAVDTYYAETGTQLFAKLQDIIDNRKLLDDCNTKTVEVHLWDEVSAGVYVAYREDAFIEVSEYGGDNTGYQIPFNIHYLGNRVKGTFNVSTRTFTADSSGATKLVTFSVSGTAGARLNKAQIVIGEQSLITDATGVVSIELAAGTYSYTVIAAGYSNVTGSITVSTSALFEAVTMTED
jgi:hypothetical protein